MLNFMIETDNIDHGLMGNSITILYKYFEYQEALIGETEQV